MAVINILKDGTVVDDMSKVTVPKDKVKSIYNMVIKERAKKEKEKSGNGN